MKTAAIVFNELNEWVYNEENQAGCKLQVIDASDLPKIVTGVVEKLTTHNVVTQRELLFAFYRWTNGEELTGSDKVEIDTFLDEYKINQNEAMPYDALFPGVFSVNTYWGSGKRTHLGTAEKIPLCGSKLQGAVLTDTEVKIEKNGEVWEFWKSEVQGSKWVKVARYNFCKHCLSALNGR